MSELEQFCREFVRREIFRSYENYVRENYVHGSGVEPVPLLFPGLFDAVEHRLPLNNYSTGNTSVLARQNVEDAG